MFPCTSVLVSGHMLQGGTVHSPLNTKKVPSEGRAGHPSSNPKAVIMVTPNPCQTCQQRKQEIKLRRELAKLKKENKQSEELNEKTRHEIAMLKKMLMFLTSIWRPEPGPAPGPGMRGHPGRGGGLRRRREGS